MSFGALATELVWRVFVSPLPVGYPTLSRMTDGEIVAAWDELHAAAPPGWFDRHRARFGRRRRIVNALLPGVNGTCVCALYEKRTAAIVVGWSR